MGDGKKHFITTSDNETRILLKNLGFNELSSDNGIYVFLNNSMEFSEDANIQMKKARFTNSLTF